MVSTITHFCENCMKHFMLESNSSSDKGKDNVYPNFPYYPALLNIFTKRHMHLCICIDYFSTSHDC